FQVASTLSAGLQIGSGIRLPFVGGTVGVDLASRTFIPTQFAELRSVRTLVPFRRARKYHRLNDGGGNEIVLLDRLPLAARFICDLRRPEDPRERQSFHPVALLSLDTDALSSSANAAHPAYGTNRNAAQRSIDHSAAMNAIIANSSRIRMPRAKRIF